MALMENAVVVADNPRDPAPKIHPYMLMVRHCSHCAAKTIHVGATGNTCLQCIADGETGDEACSLDEFKRGS